MNTIVATGRIKTLFHQAVLLAGIFASVLVEAQPQPLSDQLVADLVFTIEAGIAEPVVMGDTVDGRRQSIPITGGVVHGARIQAEVLAGGADYQVVGSDGTTHLKAVYMIRTDDGALINVENEGVLVPPSTSGNAEQYFRTSPKFRAPNGKYGWLNNAIFVCGVRMDPAKPSTVIIDVYQLR